MKTLPIILLGILLISGCLWREPSPREISLECQDACNAEGKAMKTWSNTGGCICQDKPTINAQPYHGYEYYMERLNSGDIPQECSIIDTRNLSNGEVEVEYGCEDKVVGLMTGFHVYHTTTTTIPVECWIDNQFNDTRFYLKCCGITKDGSLCEVVKKTSPSDNTYMIQDTTDGHCFVFNTEGNPFNPENWTYEGTCKKALTQQEKEKWGIREEQG